MENAHNINEAETEPVLQHAIAQLQNLNLQGTSATTAASSNTAIAAIHHVADEWPGDSQWSAPSGLYLPIKYRSNDNPQQFTRSYSRFVQAYGWTKEVAAERFVMHLSTEIADMYELEVPLASRQQYPQNLRAFEFMIEPWATPERALTVLFQVQQQPLEQLVSFKMRYLRAVKSALPTQTSYEIDNNKMLVTLLKNALQPRIRNKIHELRKQPETLSDTFLDALHFEGAMMDSSADEQQPSYVLAINADTSEQQWDQGNAESFSGSGRRTRLRKRGGRRYASGQPEDQWQSDWHEEPDHDEWQPVQQPYYQQRYYQPPAQHPPPPPYHRDGYYHGPPAPPPHGPYHYDHPPRTCAVRANTANEVAYSSDDDSTVPYHGPHNAHQQPGYGAESLWANVQTTRPSTPRQQPMTIERLSREQQTGPSEREQPQRGYRPSMHMPVLYVAMLALVLISATIPGAASQHQSSSTIIMTQLVSTQQHPLSDNSQSEVAANRPVPVAISESEYSTKGTGYLHRTNETEDKGEVKPLNSSQTYDANDAIMRMLSNCVLPPSYQLFVLPFILHLNLLMIHCILSGTPAPPNVPPFLFITMLQ